MRSGFQLQRQCTVIHDPLAVYLLRSLLGCTGSEHSLGLDDGETRLAYILG